MVDLPPGHRGRELDWAEGVVPIMIHTHQIATRAGATGIEFGHEILDRVALAREFKPRPDDRVEWFFRATRVLKLHGRRPIPVEVYGGHVVDPGGDHTMGCALAAVDFLGKLGVTVTIGEMEAES